MLFSACRLCHSAHWGLSEWGVIEDFLSALDTAACNEIAFEAILSTSPDLREAGSVRCVLFSACRLCHSAHCGMSQWRDIDDFVPASPASLDAIVHLVRARVHSRQMQFTYLKGSCQRLSDFRAYS